MNRKSILILDENEDFLNSSIEYLTLDMKVDIVTWAVSVDEAVEKVQKYAPGIVIVDLATPKYKGTEFSLWLKELSRKSKVIMTSFYDNPDYRLLARESGADGFIMKNDFKDSIAGILNYTYYDIRNFDEFIFPLN